MPRKRSPETYVARYVAKGIAEPVPLPTCDRLWNVQDVSAFLGVPVPTLHQWRYLGTGPDAFKVGRHLRYDPATVRRWLVDECRPERSA
jgi:predicted DNA-binding transcriptional regulator AlpA